MQTITIEDIKDYYTDEDGARVLNLSWPSFTGNYDNMAEYKTFYNEELESFDVSEQLNHPSQTGSIWYATIKIAQCETWAEALGAMDKAAWQHMRLVIEVSEQESEEQESREADRAWQTIMDNVDY